MMRRIVLALTASAILLCAVPARAAIAFVQQTTCFGNDATCTFGSAMGASNHILVAAVLNTQVDTGSVTGVTNGVTTLVGPTDDAGTGFRGYVFCFQGDGSDTAFVLTTSASAVARVAAAEVSGATCTVDGTGSDVSDGTTHQVAVTTTVDGAFCAALVQSNSTADFTAAGSTTPMPADNTEINTIAQGGYTTVATAGAGALDWNSAASETILAIGACVQPAAVAGGNAKALLLMGVG